MRTDMKHLRRIFVTGATGFIGSRMVNALLSEGYVIGALIRAGSDPSRLGSSSGNLSLFIGDVRDSESVFGSIGEFKPDAVIHLVTYYAVEHASADIGVMVDTNVKGTINLLEAAKMHKVKFFVNTSTCAVYEQIERPIREDDRINPQNLYAVTKLQAEEACRFYALNYGVYGMTLRLFPPYGPGDHERRLIPYVIRSLLGGRSPALTTGNQTWDFVFVDDIVRAYSAVLRAYPFKSPYDIVNIGTGQPFSIRDVVLKIRQMTGSKCELSWGAVPHRKNEVWFNSADIGKANEVFGWSPSTCLEDGLNQTIAWFSRIRE